MAAARELRPEDRPFQRHGLGWRFYPPAAPVVLTFDRVNERSDGTWAELHVTLRDGGHIVRRRVNLLGGTSLKNVVSDLDGSTGGSGWPWKAILESGCESTLEAFRSGEAIETYEGEIQRPNGVRWLSEGLVMQGCVNCWVAAASTGKSTFGVALCIHHALGEPFLGRETTKGVPLYLDWESDEDDFKEKIHDVARWLGTRSVPRIHRQRMRGPLRGRVNELAARIDALGVTLIVIDAVASAGGSMGDGNYESVAIDLEQALIALPPVTILLLDHVNGDDLKSGNVAIKARGATRKYEFVRNQWTLSLDRDLSQDGRHVVGWTHTKINRGSYLPAFGIELLHMPGELGFRDIDAVNVGPIAERMAQHRRLAAILAQEGPLSMEDAAMALLERDDKRARDQLRALFNRGNGSLMTRLPDGRIAALTKDKKIIPAPTQKPDLRVVGVSEDGPDELPF